jgi:hypothetical protein
MESEGVGIKSLTFVDKQIVYKFNKLFSFGYPSIELIANLILRIDIMIDITIQINSKHNY